MGCRQVQWQPHQNLEEKKFKVREDVSPVAVSSFVFLILEFLASGLEFRG